LPIGESPEEEWIRVPVRHDGLTYRPVGECSKEEWIRVPVRQENVLWHHSLVAIHVPLTTQVKNVHDVFLCQFPYEFFFIKCVKNRTFLKIRSQNEWASYFSMISIVLTWYLQLNEFNQSCSELVLSGANGHEATQRGRSISSQAN
jgi:hypothetical protein